MTPIEASSADRSVHRLSRRGNRRLNAAIHIVALSQLSHDSPGRAYLQRRIAEGKARREAMRALKRQLTNVLYQHLLDDAHATWTPQRERAREDSQQSALNGRLCGKSLPDPPPALHPPAAAVAGSPGMPVHAVASDPVLDTEGSLCVPSSACRTARNGTAPNTCP